jgi:HAAS
VAGVTGDLIAGYLAELKAGLRRLPQERTAEILAEAEDHLRESVAAGVAIGMTEREAQEAAISAFGSVRAVVRAHNLRPRQVAADLVLAGLRLGWTGMFAIAASGFVALVMNHLFGRSFVGGTPAPAGTYTAAQCAHWLSNWPGTGTCGQAAVLEASSDAVSLRVIGGGLGGMVLLGCYLLAAAYWRRRAPVPVLPSGFFPLAAAAVFTAGALALVVCTFTGGPFGAPAGPGVFLSGAIVAATAAVAFAARARRILRPARR